MMKLCECGCGQVAPLASKTNRRRGWIKGQPIRFINGHHMRLEPPHNLRHGQTSAAGLRSRTYVSWERMKQRCRDPRHHGYRYYGGRGISVCEKWARSFEAFLADMGERPPGHTLDRIDSNGNYEPGNCRWATPLEQRHNRRAA